MNKKLTAEKSVAITLERSENDCKDSFLSQTQKGITDRETLSADSKMSLCAIDSLQTQDSSFTPFHSPSGEVAVAPSLLVTLKNG